ncbi:MAG: ribosome maturation factor RimM [Desulfovibrio sp.]|nr:ribosome maturation factor RimM [Desulfovibrio sp.]
MPSAMILMGVLARPHGIKGEIYVDWYAASPLCADMPLWRQDGEGACCAVKVLACRWHKGRPMLRLEGVTDRNAAEALRGQKLLADRASFPKLADDEAYVEDLLGCDVLLPDGRRLGRLERVECNLGQDIWVIVTPQGAEALFPAQPCFIAGIDVAGRVVRIDPPEGLLDICLS